MSKDAVETFGRFVWEYSWLIADAVMVFVVLSMLLGYGELDAPSRVLLRGMLVGLWFYVWVSGFHLLLYIRHCDGADDSNNPGILPWWKSFPCYLIKGGIIGVLLWWSDKKGLLDWSA
ncbi:hypothetical protein G3435_14655 [Pseudomonas sp. MAFF212428]|uniref:Uncharacterized protein n=1 Tax=Pseudomonas brassicae TaxID=2708063 RepID=A0A6B3NTE3_9PSED|nr:hypothetical protein [Pseudomonas brassicae]NER60878.1 hypothetical protein [Pseudomonas brassicae]NER65196.1 hypothetical protein [Pseudomonas brassicae]